MTAKVQDSNVLASIQPQDVISYLQAHGWTEIRHVGDKGAIWSNEGESGEPLQVLLPLDRELRDYSLRLYQALQTLEVAEHRPQFAILNDLAAASSDVIRVHVKHADAASSSISLSDGVLLLRSVHDMVLAAACSTVEPRAFFPSQKPARAVEYMNRVNLGQTERGSYVVTIISPASFSSNESAAHRAFEDVMPFGRRVTEALLRALMTLRATAEQFGSSQDVSQFRATVGEGVNANLCDALVDINRSGQDTGVEIDITWSPALPVPSKPGAIYLPSHLMRSIEKIGQELRTARQEDYRLEGQIVRLERDSGHRLGIVTIEEDLGRHRMRRVRVELAGDDYRRAAQAHEEGKPIVCYGTLVTKGRVSVLKDPVGLGVLKADSRLFG